LISRTRYEPYGATAAGTEPTIGFTGHLNAANLGLVDMQQRFYDPVAGRFLSVDPVVTDANTGGSFNRYVYVNNNPFRYIDPDGRNAEEQKPDKRDQQIEEQLRKERERINPGGWSVHTEDGGGGNERSWGSYLPGTDAGANAAQYWANLQVETGNPLYAFPGVLASMWTPDTAMYTVSTLLSAGAYAGYARGFEISIGKNFRLAPFGNRTGHPTGRFPHYHRRVFQKPGKVEKGQGIDRHRPWDQKPDYDKSFWDRF
jgi:RHS repeat-associated protein